MHELYKRKGSPYWYVRLRDPRKLDGIARLSTGCASKPKAFEAAAKLQAEIDQEVERHSRAKSIRWIEAAEMFITETDLRDSTRRGYASVAVIVARTLGDFELEALTPQEIKQYVLARRRDLVTPHNAPDAAPDKRRRVSDATIRREISMVSAVYRFCLENEIENGPQTNPFLAFDRSFLKESKLIDRHLRPGQFDELLAACENDQVRRIIIVLAGTGMRTAELTGLTWGEVDFEAKMIEFGNLEAERTKTARARRIPLFPQVLDALVDQLKAQGYKAPGTPFARRPPRDALVFPSPQRGMRRFSFGHMLDKAKKKAGLPSVRVHDLRHTFASWLLQRGADPLAIQAVLGHSTLSTTRRYARHISDSVADQLREIALPITAQKPALSGENEGGNAEA
jgi:integrase